MRLFKGPPRRIVLKGRFYLGVLIAKLALYGGIFPQGLHRLG